MGNNTPGATTAPTTPSAGSAFIFRAALVPVGAVLPLLEDRVTLLPSDGEVPFSSTGAAAAAVAGAGPRGGIGGGGRGGRGRPPAALGGGRGGGTVVAV